MRPISINTLHAKLGDFLFYSLMMFCASRVADALNVFVGLWLVPKYVNPDELGAVMPLSNLAGFLAVPIAVFGSTFRNELSRLAIERKYGQMKTLLRSVFLATAVVLVLALVVCKLVLPAFLERIRVAEGSLAFLILLSSFLGAVSPIYTYALQALKKFKATSLISLAGAPVRLIAMLVAIPFRPLSGYFVGQSAPSGFSILATVVSLRREFAVSAEPYWTRDVIRRFSRLFLIFLASSLAAGFAVLVESTVLRQRLPSVESAAYYMVTRFSDVATFLASALVFTIFPFSAELAAKGKDTRPLILKASAAVLGTNAILAAGYALFGRQVLALLPHGDAYADFWWAMPWMVGLSSLGSAMGFYITSETAANRFGYMKWWVGLDLLYPVALLAVTGHGYFDAHLPGSWVRFLTDHNIFSLQTMMLWMTACTIIRFCCCIVAMKHQNIMSATK